MTNVVKFRRSASVVRIATADRPEGKLIQVWAPAPGEKRDWRCRSASSIPTRPAPALSSPASGQIERLAIQQTTPRDTSDEIASLPPLDAVTRILEGLIPAKVVSLSPSLWISGTRDHALTDVQSRVPESRVPEEKPAKILSVEEHPDDGGIFASLRGLDRYALEEQHTQIYKWTYTSWSEMKQRCRKEKLPVDPRLDAFADFLTEVGPRIRREYTLDRIKPGGLGGEYVPGNMRWIDKEGQANNRPNTRMLTFKGKKVPAALLAKQQGVKRNTLLKRIDQGWTEEEAVAGRRNAWPPDQRRPWDHHEDDGRRDAAEEFYNRFKSPGETPAEFCLRKFLAGLRPWREFLDGLGFYADSDEDPTAGIAEHCIPVLKNADDVLRRLEPQWDWIMQISDKMRRAAERAKIEKRSSRRVYRRRNMRDREAEHTNYCESYPELADRDDEAF